MKTADPELLQQARWGLKQRRKPFDDLLAGRDDLDRLIAMLAFVEWLPHREVVQIMDRLAADAGMHKAEVHARLADLCLASRQ